MHESDTAVAADKPSLAATLVLTNGDSLTVSMLVNEIPLQTEWGKATVYLASMRSMTVGEEVAAFIEVDGRWELSPITDPPSTDDRADAVNEDTAVEESRASTDARHPSAT